MTDFLHDSVVPFADSSKNKKAQVAQMFNNISFRYDILNKILSFGIDQGWRKKALGELESKPIDYLVDIATGTADMCLLAHKQLHPKQIVGIDIAVAMLAEGRKKINKQQLQHHITLIEGDSENLEIESNTVDAVTVAFGVRNFEQLEKGLAEMKRILKPGGKLVILEFSYPEHFFMKWLFKIYMNFIGIAVAGMVAKNTAAYRYLYQSMKLFPQGSAFLKLLKNTGFKTVYLKRLNMQLCTIYCGVK